MKTHQELKKIGWTNLKEYYDFLNFNFLDYIDIVGFSINESTTYDDYAKLYNAFFKYQYKRPYYFNDLHTYQNYQNGIYESLITHDIKKFENALYDYCVSIRITNTNDTGLLTVMADDDSDKNLINQLCVIYGYYVTLSEYNEHNIYVYIIESTYGYKDVSTEVYNIHNGILYHITSISHVDKIKKIGLIPKHLDKKVTHPGRLYFTTNSNINELKKLGEELYLKKLRYAILKIDLNQMPDNIKLKFYVDPAYEKYGVFTCENISPKCISVIDYDYNTKNFKGFNFN